MTTTEPRDFSSALSLTSSIAGFGDSLLAGAGSSLSVMDMLRIDYPDRLVQNFSIGGQTAEQIAARQGGLPVTVTLTGDTFAASQAAVTLTSISTQLGSTPSDNNTRYISGTILTAGGLAQCVIERTASGGPPSTSETYKIYPALNTTSAVPAKSVFTPDDGRNTRHAIQVLWLGRNNVPTVSGVPALVDSCVATLAAPRRAVVIGILPSLTETSGTSRTNIDAANVVLAATYGDLFVPTTPPTSAEMTAIGYTPSAQDNTDIAAGVFPTGMHSDNTHLNESGYRIIYRRVRDVIAAQGW